MGDRDVQAGVANLALTLVSAWSYLQCESLLYVSLGFCLYTAVGLTGVLEFLLNSWDAHRVHSAVFRWSHPFYYPLVTVQALQYFGVVERRLSLVLLVAPIVYVVLSEILDQQVSRDLVNLNTIVCSVALCYVAYKRHALFAVVYAILGHFAFFNAGFVSSSALDHKVFVMLAHLAAVQLFTNHFKL